MPAVQRQGDANTGGGVASGGVQTVRVNGRPMLVPNISVTPHPCFPRKNCSQHGSAVTKGGSKTVRAESKPVIRSELDIDTCGHPRAGGSTNTRVES